MLKKESILEIPNVYTGNAFHTSTGSYIGAGSETDPDIRLYNLDTGVSASIPESPGGMMSFIPVPGHPDAFVTIMGLFPPFKGKNAGLWLHRLENGEWNSWKALDLPFAHRCEFLTHEAKTFLIAASVSRFKEDPADWTRPGEIHLVPLEKDLSVEWKSQVIGPGITRNHGMTRAFLNGRESLCVSGVEGIFSIFPGGDGKMEVLQEFDREVSEFAFIDLDGDGNQELITIEPFHGPELKIYKQSASRWELKYSHPLSFGHGLNSGVFNGIPMVTAGSRRDQMELQVFINIDLDKGLVNRKIIEEGAGPTQTQIFSHAGEDYILSVNQRKNEVALYSGSLE